VGTTSLVGREQAIDELAGLLGGPGVRLVTLTGPGGVGKTRLALAAGERLRGRFATGAAFVPLAAAARPEQVVAGIARAVGRTWRGRAPRWRPWPTSSATAAGCCCWTTSSRSWRPPPTSASCWPAAPA
jgi:MoxR-like ATPase